MKKFASILLTVALLAAMLSVCALPANAWPFDFFTQEEKNPYEVGQWFYEPLQSEMLLTGIKLLEADYICVLGIVSADTCSVAHYIYNSEEGKITDTKTETLQVSQLKKYTVSQKASIPAIVQEIAEQDIADYNSTGSALSNGSIWIIAGVAVAAIGGIAAILIVQRKKKA